MPQDAFTLRLIAKELNEELRGGHVNKIVQPSKDEVSLLIYTGRRTVKLTLNTNASDCGAYFERTETPVPLVAPNFCMLLRKHLQGAEITGVELVGFERILRFRFFSGSDFSAAERDLYAEIMGKYSNLILLDEKGVILGALKTTSLDTNAKRMIFPGVPYAPPAPQEGKVSPLDPSLGEVLQNASGDLGHFLFTRVSGLAPSTAEEIASSFAGGDLRDHLLAYLFSDMVCPRVVIRDGAAVDFCARGDQGIPFETLSEAQTYFYGERRAQKSFEGRKRKLLAAVSASVKKHEKRLSAVLQKRKECEGCEQNRIKGELLTANLYALTRGMKGAELENWYDGTTIKIALDERLTPAENAQSYFKRYRKQKRTLETIAPQEEETRAELDYLGSLNAAVLSAETADDLAALEEELGEAQLINPAEKGRGKRQKPEIPYRAFERQGFRIFAGRNNLQNDRLVRSASPDDLWLHAERYHSCHVIVKTEGKEPPEDVLAFAAAIAARYSDAHGDVVPVSCTRVKYVKKPKGCKAGFVTYTQSVTLAGDPQKAE